MKNKLTYIVAIILLIPILMFLFWLFTPKTKFVVAIIDKTVATDDGQEHISLNWILNQEKYAKTTKKGYNVSYDYFGFFPKHNTKFRLKGLERFTTSQIEQLSNDADMVYITDTYGIYKKEWFDEQNDNRSSGILYGGLSTQDLLLLQQMKAKRKLIITEFNTIGSPTSADLRTQFETLFGMHWTGWTARYFNSLDTNINLELPTWLVKNYKAKHQNKWKFKRAGLAFVSDNDEVVILEDTTHMVNAMPYIISDRAAQEKYGLPEKMKYPFWFDVIIPNKKVNKIVSNFDLQLNENGKKELTKYGIPTSFPAIITQRANNYKFYYFSGDFCDNPISLGTSYFKGIDKLKFLFFNVQDPMERKSFFWNFYHPLITTILKEEAAKLKKKN